MNDDRTAATRDLIELFYVSYLAGDREGMLALLVDDAVVTFVGHGTFRGKDEIRAYMAWASTQLRDLDFRICSKIVDGDWAAVAWVETATTRAGEPWESVGVDVYRVVGERIAELTVHSDTAKMQRQIEAYHGPGATA